MLSAFFFWSQIQKSVARIDDTTSTQTWVKEDVPSRFRDCLNYDSLPFGDLILREETKHNATLWGEPSVRVEAISLKNCLKAFAEDHGDWEYLAWHKAKYECYRVIDFKKDTDPVDPYDIEGWIYASRDCVNPSNPSIRPIPREIPPSQNNKATTWFLSWFSSLFKYRGGAFPFSR